MSDDIPETAAPIPCRCSCCENIRLLRGEIAIYRMKIVRAEAEARRYAGLYPEASDGRNTFVMLADRIAEIAND